MTDSHGSIARQSYGDTIGNSTRFTSPYNTVPFQRSHNGRRTFGLYSNQARYALDHSQQVEVFKATINTADNTPIPCRHQHSIRYLPRQLLCNLQASSLLALNKIGVIACVAIVPAKGLTCLDAQIKGIIVAAIHSKNGRPAHKQLHDFGTRGIVWHKDIAR